MGYGFGIIGTGMIGDFHAKAIAAIEGATLVACMDSVPGKAKAFADRNGGKPHESMDTFLSQPDLDIVTICTPSGAHLEPALAAIEAGRHLIIEKPIEISLERIDRIIEAANKRGVTVAGIFPSRFHEAPRMVKQAVDEGRFGRLTLGDAYVKWYRSPEYYAGGGWKGTWKLDGGGALMNQSIHAVDLLQWLMGPVERVSAYAATLAHQGIEVEDTAVAVLRFRNGAFGVIEGSTAAYPGFLKRVELSGMGGSAVIEEEDLKVWDFREKKPKDEEIRTRFMGRTATGGGAADPSAIGFHGHTMQFEDFIRALDEKGTPLVDGTEARKAVEIILAIYESARSGKEVKLPLGG